MPIYLIIHCYLLHASLICMYEFIFRHKDREMVHICCTSEFWFYFWYPQCLGTQKWKERWKRNYLRNGKHLNLRFGMWNISPTPLLANGVPSYRSHSAKWVHGRCACGNDVPEHCVAKGWFERLAAGLVKRWGPSRAVLIACSSFSAIGTALGSIRMAWCWGETWSNMCIALGSIYGAWNHDGSVQKSCLPRRCGFVSLHVCKPAS